MYRCFDDCQTHREVQRTLIPRSSSRINDLGGLHRALPLHPLWAGIFMERRASYGPPHKEHNCHGFKTDHRHDWCLPDRR